MKHVHELVGDYIDEHPEEFERGKVGMIVPDGTDERVVARWLDESMGSGNWAAGLRGATKEDACCYARRVLASFSDKADDVTTARILECVNAFADWEKNLTKGPEVVISYCGWMRSELQRRWREPLILWPWVAVELTFCELSIRSYHRLETKEAESTLAMLVINAAHFFDAHKRPE
ncbi:hypothetical protein OKA04_02195 [Luteolibacter flavescens]|uniref:Uncharacterized protein n=1 Tax=Luteolibacter flavescens TaxID=1859460 RepID=A0ABT3FJ00_9BACT|nr:hypothetical protein [Luteolibacter flavescens]MCW1883520.1 hypothetical protein [Luteolibacter flavescens]